MEKTYTYDPYYYRNKVQLINTILACLLLYSLYNIVSGQANILWIGVIAISGYALMNTYITKSNPREIIISDESITFRSYGEKRYDIDKLKTIRMRITTSDHQVYVRVADSDGHKGRFWVTFGYFSDKYELIEEFDYIERKIHPESLRFNGREDRGHHRPGHKDGTNSEGGTNGGGTPGNGGNDSAKLEQHNSTT